MSQPTPREFDAILGGDNLLARDAAVLGGLAGAEQKLAHELRSRHNQIDSDGWKLPDPIDPVKERERLSRIVRGLSNRQIECQFTEPPPYLVNRLTANGRRDFDRDLAAVKTDQIEIGRAHV